MTINLNSFLLGLFFLIWATSTYTYVEAGNLGKYLSLIIWVLGELVLKNNLHYLIEKLQVKILQKK